MTRARKAKKLADRKSPLRAAARATPGKARPTNRKTAPRPNRRRNSDAQASELAAAFHGRPPKRTRDVTTTEAYWPALADLGALIELHVRTAAGKQFTLDFRHDGARLAAAPTAHQLYIISKPIPADLRALGITSDADLVAVGHLTRVVYKTSKAFHSFQPIEYFHDLGEETGELPILLYDTLSQSWTIAGGAYQIKPEGIVN